MIDFQFSSIFAGYIPAAVTFVISIILGHRRNLMHLSSERILQHVSSLQQIISGSVMTPTDCAYADVVAIDNGRITYRPPIVVRADGLADVQRTIGYAKKEELKVSIKGGGHSAAGYSLNRDGIVLDLSLMKKIRLNMQQETISIEMGCLWGEVYSYLSEHGNGLLPVGGGCPTVGVPGFMLGGGYSFVSRSYGLAVDNLISLKIVTADTNCQTISINSTGKEKDLFWACCGGGGGNFGVVVEMEIRLHHPKSPKMFSAQVRYAPNDAESILATYVESEKSWPNELAVYGIWGTQPHPANPNKLIKAFGFTAVFNGEFSEGHDLIQPLLRHKPLYANMGSYTLPEFEDVNGRSTLVGRRKAYIRSGVLNNWTNDVSKIMKRNMDVAPSPATFMVWTHAGGEITRINKEIAFPFRSAKFVPEVKAIWDGQSNARENIEWAYQFFEELRPSFVGAYANYIDPLLSDWPQMYYGSNYQRLCSIKKYWDPDNFFRFQQGINSTYNPQSFKPGQALDLSPLSHT